MHFFSQSFRYDHPWSHVVIGMWHKYPNSKCTHVVSIDTLSRTVDPKTGVIRTERVLGCKQKAPLWIVKLFGGSEDAYVREISFVDPASQNVTISSVNLSLSQFATCHEQIRYNPISSTQTSFSQTAEIQARLAVWRSVADSLEKWLVQRFEQNAQLGKSGFTDVLRNLWEERHKMDYISYDSHIMPATQNQFSAVDSNIDADSLENISDSEPEEGEEPILADGQPSASTSTSQKKKRKKKSKAKRALNAIRRQDEIPQEVVDQVLDKLKEDGVVGSENANAEDIRQAIQRMEIMDVVKGKAGVGGLNKKDMGEHKFWATQPVPQLGEGPPIEDGYIEPSRPREEVRQEPFPLPKDFEWSILDISDPIQNKEVYDLLSLNYIEDDQAAFRFQYSAEFLAWALMPPGYHKEWHVGVRVSSNKKLVAFISGIPITLRVRQHVILATEINYLCVHKKLRSKRLAPVLIKEVTRQCHLKGVFQAIYTAGIVIPTPVSVCRYYHRSLNIPKLVDTRFCYVPRNMTLARMARLNALPKTTTLIGLREMQERDIISIGSLFSQYMKRFDMSPLYDLEEIKHQFLSGRGRGEMGSGGVGRREGQVTWSYVVENPETGKVTDFFSFYSLPSTVIRNTTHPVLEAAYLFYYATDVGLDAPGDQDEKLEKRLLLLIGDALIVANEAKFDVFNALTLMDNMQILQDLKFGLGDGFLNFYLYNWRTSPLSGMNSENGVTAGKGVGVVML